MLSDVEVDCLLRVHGLSVRVVPSGESPIGKWTRWLVREHWRQHLVEVSEALVSRAREGACGC